MGERPNRYEHPPLGRLITSRAYLHGLIFTKGVFHQRDLEHPGAQAYYLCLGRTNPADSIITEITQVAIAATLCAKSI